MALPLLKSASITLADCRRFWSKVDATSKDHCWPWLAGFHQRGYPVFWLDGKLWFANRVAWLLTRGEISDSMLICHKCDNPACVNPMHLFEGSYAANHDDMKIKGRRASFAGARNSQSKLSDSDVKTMRSLHAGGMRTKLIANQFGVCREVAGKAIRGTTWKHVK